MSSDRNFNDLAPQLKSNIYGSLKGEIRLAVIWEDLRHAIAQLDEGRGRHLLDAGCGFAQVSRRLLRSRWEGVLCDIADEILLQVGEALRNEGLAAQLRHMPLQALGGDETLEFDLILTHAVLEWMEEPRQVIDALAPRLRRGGHWSLLFYNRTAHELRLLLAGQTLIADMRRPHGRSRLTPTHPLYTEEVVKWLEQAGLRLISLSGVRCFHDLMPIAVRERLGREALIEQELRYRHLEPYRSLGRLIHLIARKE